MVQRKLGVKKYLWVWGILSLATAAYAEKMAPVNSMPIPGVVMTRAGWWRDNAYGLAIQKDDKLVATGAIHNGSKLEFAILRFEKNGGLDRNFGDLGKTAINFGYGDDKGYSTVIQPDGKILAVGSASNGVRPVFAVIRLLPSGQVDPTFGINGKTLIPIGTGEATAYSVVLGPTGKIIAFGSCQTDAGLEFAVVRLDSNGNLDYAFGNEGKQTLSFGHEAEAHGYSAALQDDGRLVLAGYVVKDGRTRMAIARLKEDGFLDKGFADKGMAQLSLRNYQNDSAYSVAILPDKKILLGGASSNGQDLDFAVARLNPNGALDKTFGTGGSTLLAVGPSVDIVYGIYVQNDGKIVASGAAYDGVDFDFALARFNGDGKVDTTFGKRGAVMSKLSKQYDAAYAVTESRDGKIISAGVSFSETRYVIAMARYLVTGMLDPTFNGQGESNQLARSDEDNAISAGVALPLPAGLISLPAN